MTESEKWAAMRKTALADHEPFCNYGRTNGREMCTCQVLVDLVEAPDAADNPFLPPDYVVPSGRTDQSRSAQRARRLSERQKSAARRKR